MQIASPPRILAGRNDMRELNCSRTSYTFKACQRVNVSTCQS